MRHKTMLAAMICLSFSMVALADMNRQIWDIPVEKVWRVSEIFMQTSARI